MAVGKGIHGELLPVDGISIGVACAGVKEIGRRDLVVFELSPGSSVAVVFTQNQFRAAPVLIAEKHLQSSLSPRFLVINTGNANAGTGSRGMEDALETCTRLAAKRSVSTEQVLPFSTGVIGEYLPMSAIINGLPDALSTMSNDHWMEAALGIQTTDTRPKGHSIQFEFDGETITVTGIAKGAGMIKPNMATMLSFVATDAPVSKQCLQQILQAANEKSFNRITVDGDTSTNDANVLVATGKAPVKEVTSSTDELFVHLSKTVREVMLSLAQQLVRDGEGATKFIAVNVVNAESKEQALGVAYSVAESPLFKTAMSASDANWGRILMAVGKAPVKGLLAAQIDVFIGDVQIVEKGERCHTYTEEQGESVVAQEDIELTIKLNLGDSSETVWTTDLSHDYVTINAEYRT